MRLQNLQEVHSGMLKILSLLKSRNTRYSTKLKEMNYAALKCSFRNSILVMLCRDMKTIEEQRQKVVGYKVR